MEIEIENETESEIEVEMGVEEIDAGGIYSEEFERWNNERYQARLAVAEKVAGSMCPVHRQSTWKAIS